MVVFCRGIQDSSINGEFSLGWFESSSKARRGSSLAYISNSFPKMFRGLNFLVIVCYLGLSRLLPSLFAALSVPVCFEDSTKTPGLGPLHFEDLSSQISHSRANRGNQIPFFEFLPTKAPEENWFIPEGVSENAENFRGEDRWTVMVEENREIKTQGYSRPSITEKLPQVHSFRDFQTWDPSINHEPHRICVPTETHSDGTEVASAPKLPAENWYCLETQSSSNESSNEALKKFVGDIFEMNLADKELPKIIYPVLFRHNGRQMNYGPFHEFNRISMRKVVDIQTLVPQGYRENLREFLGGYACGYCKGWLSRKAKRERQRECQVLSKLYKQSGISNAKKIGMFREICEHFFKKQQRYIDGPNRSGGITYNINLSKGITFMFLQHIRFIYEIIEVYSRQDELEGLILMHQRKGVEFSFRFWNSFDYKRPSLPKPYHELEDSNKAVQKETHQTPRSDSKELPKRILGEPNMLQWSWHMLKEYLILVKEPMNEIFFSSRTRTKGLEAFSKHCAIAELMHD